MLGFIFSSLQTLAGNCLLPGKTQTAAPTPRDRQQRRPRFLLARFPGLLLSGTREILILCRNKIKALEMGSQK